MGAESVMSRIGAMLERADGGNPPFPPTVLYNENWMLRLVLECLVERGSVDGPIPVLAGVRWYSEPLLPSAFLPRSRGDLLGESYTHADGVIGHFSIGGKGKGDLVLAPNARQFTVIEGKMLSRLSKGVSNAPYFDQAARNVACMAEVVRISGKEPETLSEIGFFVVAPDRQIKRGIFEDLVSQASMRGKVRDRVLAYEGGLDEWFERWFEPVLERARLGLLSWEEVLEYLEAGDAAVGKGLWEFYERCLALNAGVSRTEG